MQAYPSVRSTLRCLLSAAEQAVWPSSTCTQDTSQRCASPQTAACTWVGRVARALEAALEAQHVLLAHGAGLLVVLEAPQLHEVEEDQLQEEQRVRVCTQGQVSVAQAASAAAASHCLLLLTLRGLLSASW